MTYLLAMSQLDYYYCIISTYSASPLHLQPYSSSSSSTLDYATF